LQAKGTFFAANVSPSRKGYQPDALFALNQQQLRGLREWRFRADKVARRPSHGSRFFDCLWIATSVALCACLSVKAAEQESRARYEAQFQLERDPVAKARILAKLGRFEIDQARADLKANNDEQSLADLEHYRDQVESTVQALSATGVNQPARNASAHR
jgi:hypothetical protein